MSEPHLAAPNACAKASTGAIGYGRRRQRWRKERNNTQPSLFEDADFDQSSYKC